LASTLFEIGILNMIGKTNAVLFAIGIFLLCAEGLVTFAMHWVFLVILAAGFAFLLVAAVRSRISGAFSVLWLLAASNLSFWGCYGVWFLKNSVFFEALGRKIPEVGAVTEIGGVFAIWLMFLTISVFYELIILMRHLVAKRQRSFSVILMIFVLAQIPTTMKFVWDALKGV